MSIIQCDGCHSYVDLDNCVDVITIDYKQEIFMYARDCIQEILTETEKKLYESGQTDFVRID